MPFIGRVCNVGVFDESIPDIKFDDMGKSNYALLYDSLIELYPRGNKGEKDWSKFLQIIKDTGKSKKYDCVIGVSGGTDSCYLLHLAKQWNLRILAVYLDNGWNSDIAVNNIRKMIEKLNIDLETYVINYEEIKDLIKCYMNASLPWIDLPTDLAIKSALYKVANREGIKYILRGNDFRSEGTQPKEWTYGDGKQLLALHKKFGKVKLKTYPNYTIANTFYYSYVKGIKSLYPFYYVDYNKNNAQQFLKDNYDWVYYGGHHYENIFTKFTMSYWLFEKFGIDKRKITLSAQIMSNEITRDLAVKKIEKKPYDINQKDEMIAYVCENLDLSKDDFISFFNLPNKSYKNYPSYDNLFNKYKNIFRWFVRKLFLHKPQSLVREEIIG